LLAGLRRFVPDGHEANLNPPVEGGGDAPEHGQGMALIVRILQALSNAFSGI
jgi:hypothetical protein